MFLIIPRDDSGDMCAVVIGFGHDREDPSVVVKVHTETHLRFFIKLSMLLSSAKRHQRLLIREVAIFICINSRPPLTTIVKHDAVIDGPGVAVRFHGML